MGEVLQIQRKLETLQNSIETLQNTVAAQAIVIAQQTKLSKTKNENYYQQILEDAFNTGHLHLPGVGVTDLSTNTAHIEIKNWIRYQQVPGQLATYQQASRREKSIVYFFGKPPSAVRLEQIERLMEACEIQMFSFDEDDNIREHRCTLTTTKTEKSHNQWLKHNLIKSDRDRVHLHRVQRLYEQDLKKQNDEVPSDNALRRAIRENGFKFANKRLKDCLCICNNNAMTIEGIRLRTDSQEE